MEIPVFLKTFSTDNTDVIYGICAALVDVDSYNEPVPDNITNSGKYSNQDVHFFKEWCHGVAIFDDC